MNKALTNTLKLFELEKIDRDIYAWSGSSVGFGRIFGGQVMAQTLMAAYSTVDKKRLIQKKFLVLMLDLMFLVLKKKLNGCQ